jgi:hypothetical protein
MFSCAPPVWTEYAISLWQVKASTRRILQKIFNKLSATGKGRFSKRRERMKSLLLVPLLLFLQSYRPFAQDGSVDTDTGAIDERLEKARQNKLQEKRAEEMLREEEQHKEERDRNLRPDILLQENEKKDGSAEKP